MDLSLPRSSATFTASSIEFRKGQLSTPLASPAIAYRPFCSFVSLPRHTTTYHSTACHYSGARATHGFMLAATFAGPHLNDEQSRL